MRALVVTNMYPTVQHPARGAFVRDQVRALRRLTDVDLELFTFDSGGAKPYLSAARDLRRRYGDARFDVIHAHFGLTAWPSLALRGAPHAVTLHGTDLIHPRSRAISRAAFPFLDLVAPVSESLAREVPARKLGDKLTVLPCGVDTERFRPIPREEARRALGLDQSGPYLLFPADPARHEKRFDRARELAEAIPELDGGARLLTLGNVDPDQMPTWVNAASAVVVTSERESFGMAVLEALACDVPVLSTEVGVAPEMLGELEGAHCGPFDLQRWRSALVPLLNASDPRVHGRERAERYSATRMAARVLSAWKRLV